MYQVRADQVANHGTSGQHAVPTAVDLICPSCRRDVTFTLPNWSSGHTQGLPNQSRCPRCAEITTFIRLGGASLDEMRLFVDADPVGREPLPGLAALSEEAFSIRLKKAYQSALRAFSIGDYEATAVHCRRVLEGVTSVLLANEADTPRNLARRLERLAKNHADVLARPLLDLSSSLKDGGNLGAHFDDEADTTADDAGHMVELLEILITYLFVLPAELRRFRTEVLGEELGDG